MFRTRRRLARLPFTIGTKLIQQPLADTALAAFIILFFAYVAIAIWQTPNQPDATTKIDDHFTDDTDDDK